MGSNPTLSAISRAPLPSDEVATPARAVGRTRGASRRKTRTRRARAGRRRTRDPNRCRASARGACRASRASCCSLLTPALLEAAHPRHRREPRAHARERRPLRQPLSDDVVRLRRAARGPSAALESVAVRRRAVSGGVLRRPLLPAQRDLSRDERAARHRALGRAAHGARAPAGWRRSRAGCASTGRARWWRPSRFAWSGWFVFSTNQPRILAAIAWLPWTLWLVDRVFAGERRAALVLTLGVAAQLLIGDAEHVLHGMLAGALLAALRLGELAARGAWRDALARGGALRGRPSPPPALLTAFQLLPDARAGARRARARRRLRRRARDRLRRLLHPGALPAPGGRGDAAG